MDFFPLFIRLPVIRLPSPFSPFYIFLPYIVLPLNSPFFRSASLLNRRDHHVIAFPLAQEQMLAEEQFIDG